MVVTYTRTVLVLFCLSACSGQEAAGDVSQDAHCSPLCDGDGCGLDGCGGVCGVCQGATTCVRRQCVASQVEVAAGPFLRGCQPEGDPQCQDVEQPERALDLSAFHIDVVEVSVVAYRTCVLAGQCTEPGSGDYCNWGDAQRVYHPVNCVSWSQANAYCGWAGKRLCSEAEWEKASRGTSGGRFPWGEEAPDCEVASWGGPTGPCGESSTTEVGGHPAGISPAGVLDASGNVWEWVQDWYDGAWYGNSPSASGPDGGQFKVVRGGSFGSESPDELRSAHRWAQLPEQSGVGLGFRCCRD